jgi:ferritin
MLNKKIEKKINEQINEELFSAYLYLAMSAYCEDINLPGFANWMTVQFEEEQFHAMKFINYINERGGRVELEALEKPQVEWKNMIDVFEATLKHERHITSKINEIMDLAIEERDHATVSFLNWYVDEQVEEEDTAEGILDRLKMINGEGNGMLMLDKEMAARTFTAPAEEE